MSELIDFATRLIELEGGAVEARAHGIGALLPASLSKAWGSQDELELSDDQQDAARFAYGSELLDRMLQTATQSVPLACAHLDLNPPRRSQVQRAAEAFRLRNGVVDIGEIRMISQTRLWVDALATLHGDEKRELLVSAAVSRQSGTYVEGFIEAASSLSPMPSASFPHPAARLLDAALSVCSRQAEQGAASFRAGMTRRFDRDRLRIEGYFDDLLSELDKRAQKGRLDRDTIADKRKAMLADRAAKLDALTARFVLRVEVMPIALRSVEVSGAVVALSLRRRKASRVVELEYDAATRKLVPPMCEACHGAAPRPAACDDAIHLLCETCSPRAEGRIACSACRRGAATKQVAPFAQV